jgi:hypothetical protein
MRFRRGMVLAFLTVSRLGQVAATQARGEHPGIAILGTWRGNSVCLLKGSACREEQNVYRFSKAAGKPGVFSGTASKVVDGREIVMGRSDWTYDAEKHVLECKTPQIRMLVDGARMEGDLELPDGTAYRRISLKKGRLNFGVGQILDGFAGPRQKGRNDVGGAACFGA